MTIDLDDFLRLLPRALNGRSFELSDDSARVSEGNKAIVISFAKQHKNKIGSLELPEMLVTISMLNYLPEEQAEFIERFDLAYRRGGG